GPEQYACGRRPAGAGTAEAGGQSEEVGVPGLHRLPGGREEVQVAEAAPAHPLRPVAGRTPRQMGPAGRLSDGRAELRRRPLGARQEDGPRPAAPPEVDPLALSFMTRPPRFRPAAVSFCGEARGPALRQEGLMQADVAVEVIGPVPGPPAIAFVAERPRQTGKDGAAARRRDVGDLARADRDEARQLALADIVLDAGGDDLSHARGGAARQTALGWFGRHGG